MAVLAQVRSLHNFQSRTCEYGAVANLSGHTEDECETVRSLNSLFLVLCIDTNMSQFEAQHGLYCFSGQLLDLVPLTGIDQVTGNHPGTTASDDLGEVKVRSQVLSVYATGRHELHVYIRSCHSLDLSQTAGLLSREELNYIQAKLDSLLDVAGAGSTGSDRNVLLYTILNGSGI